TTGQLDPTFGTNGIALFSHSTELQPWTVAVQPDGKIIVGSYGFVDRFDSYGAIDRTFGDNGSAHDTFANTFPDGAGVGRAVTLQPDGKIVAVGIGRIRIDRRTTKDVFLIARYQGDSTGPLSASRALNVGPPSIGPSAATGSRSGMSLAIH